MFVLVSAVTFGSQIRTSWLQIRCKISIHRATEPPPSPLSSLFPAIRIPSMKTPGDLPDELRVALQAIRRPFCNVGSIPLDDNTPLTLFFLDEEGKSNHLPLPCNSAQDVQPLLEACKKAPFGRGSETILDPAYRRALMLPSHRFSVSPSTTIDPYLCGILDNISHHLLNRSNRRIIATLDKLNVYGPGDFFKGHVDTPRSSDMFGTLVINLPVSHEGGELVIFSSNAKLPRAASDSTSTQVEGAEPHTGDKYSTKWGKIDSIDWIAFFSDCPHEVLPVQKGY
ncbi:hypothetical protein DL93DRAFT_2141150, partial [Clavulina sp. PMI_390]